MVLGSATSATRWEGMGERIAVVGAGYVGLATSVCLAAAGRQVTLIEIDPERRDAVIQGRAPIHEPGIEELLRQAVESGRLLVSGQLAPVLKQTDVVVIAVGTPPGADGGVDLGPIQSVTEEVRRFAHPDTVLVVKSTVPPGTCNRLGRILAGDPFSIPVVCCPEFLREGCAINDIRHAPRFVVGGSDPGAVERVTRLLNLAYARVVRTDSTSAELIKYGSNGFLAIKISFINELANLCDLMDGNIDAVAEGMGLDPRIGRAFLDAGLGFGGSCFPKDVRALDFTASREGYSFWMLKAALEVNEQQRMRFVQKVRYALGNNMGGRRVAVLGLAFKPNTDDMRQASSIAVCNRLIELGADVVAHDPVAMENARREGLKVEFAPDVYACATGADAVALVTEWPEYLELDWARIAQLVRQRIVVDGRNCLDMAQLVSFGFSYHSIGHSPQVLRWARRFADVPATSGSQPGLDAASAVEAVA
jgi:UDPglucose 6-dehydrogenase